MLFRGWDIDIATKTVIWGGRDLPPSWRGPGVSPNLGGGPRPVYAGLPPGDRSRRRESLGRRRRVGPGSVPNRARRPLHLGPCGGDRGVCRWQASTADRSVSRYNRAHRSTTGCRGGPSAHCAGHHRVAASASGTGTCGAASSTATRWSISYSGYSRSATRYTILRSGRGACIHRTVQPWNKRSRTASWNQAARNTNGSWAEANRSAPIRSGAQISASFCQTP